MSHLDELEYDLIKARNHTDINIDELIRLAALQEKAKIFNNLRMLIQQKDSVNDIIAAQVLAWAWQELSELSLQ